MTHQWRKDQKSDLAKPGFSLPYGHYSTLIFHTLCRGGVILSGVRTSENQITPGAHVYTPVHHQWTKSVLCGGLRLELTAHRCGQETVTWGGCQWTWRTRARAATVAT
jgi:hypothetical protein